MKEWAPQHFVLCCFPRFFSSRWQGQDYTEFRKNYVRFIRTPSSEDDPDWEAAPTADPVVGSPTSADITPASLSTNEVPPLDGGSKHGPVQAAVLLVATAAVSSSRVKKEGDEEYQEAPKHRASGPFLYNQNGRQHQQQQPRGKYVHKKEGEGYHHRANYCGTTRENDVKKNHGYHNERVGYSYNHHQVRMDTSFRQA